MLGWSINLFRIAGIRLAAHWTLLFLFGYVMWEGARAAGALGAAWMTLYLVLLLTCVVLHELGNCLAARQFGVRIPRILLMPIGGMAEFDRMPRAPRRELAIALAGPAVNAGLVVVLLLLGVRFPVGWQWAELPLSLAELGRHLVVLNVVMGCFNLLPAFPMDGGRIFRALLALRLPYLRATFYAAALGKVLALVGATTLAFVFHHWLGALLFLFIFVAGEAEYRVLKRAEDQEARWQAVLDLIGPPAPLLPRRECR